MNSPMRLKQAKAKINPLGCTQATTYAPEFAGRHPGRRCAHSTLGKSTLTLVVADSRDVFRRLFTQGTAQRITTSQRNEKFVQPKLRSLDSL